MGTTPMQPPAPPDEPKTKSVKWYPASADDRFDVRLAEGSIQPMSQSALRTLALELKKVGAIDVRHLLEWCGVPDADEIAAAIENEQKLAALAKITRK